MKVNIGMTLCSINSGATLAILATSSSAACCTCGFSVVLMQPIRTSAFIAEGSICEPVVLYAWSVRNSECDED